jgi:N-acetyl-gamma-glutamyl-phosphate reductase
MPSIRAGVVGGAGFTGGELLRLLLLHGDVDVASVVSTSHAGESIWEIHRDLRGETELRFVQEVSGDPDVLFLCVSAGEAKTYLQTHPPAPRSTVIDLSADHRLASFANGPFIYGLPEFARDRLLSARSDGRHVANPGCFATAVALAMLPLAEAGHLIGDVHASAITGSTGAGRQLTPTVHFSWRAGNAQVYEPFTHRHVHELAALFRTVDPAWSGSLRLVPYRGAFTRGIVAACYTRTELPLAEARGLYARRYASHPFVRLVDASPDVKAVANTNACHLWIARDGADLLVVSAIDNLLKGAAGQAVENMNLVFGFDERRGLRLKATGW